MTLQRYKVGLTGWPGQPGTMTFYLSPSVTDFSPIRTLCSALAIQVPNGLSFVFPSSVDLFSETTGTMSSTLAITPGATVTSSVTAATYSGTSGALIRWVTGDFVRGKRVQGRNFIVPLRGAAYANDGSVSSSVTTALQAAAATMISSFGAGLQVWARPTFTDTKPPVLVNNGSAHTVNSATVPNTPVVMRSRRV